MKKFLLALLLPATLAFAGPEQQDRLAFCQEAHRISEVSIQMRLMGAPPAYIEEQLRIYLAANPQLTDNQKVEIIEAATSGFFALSLVDMEACMNRKET